MEDILMVVISVGMLMTVGVAALMLKICITSGRKE